MPRQHLPFAAARVRCERNAPPRRSLRYSSTSDAVRMDGESLYLDRHTAAKELWLSGALLALTAIALVFIARDELHGLGIRVSRGDTAAILEQVILIVVLGFLIFGNVVYQLERIGYLQRIAGHQPVAREHLASFETGGLPPLLALVPAYREEPRVVAQTLLSAALQRYPMRVVLLIDDPPSTEPDRQEDVRATRRLPVMLQGYLEEPLRRVARAQAAFEGRAAASTEEAPLDPARETRAVAQLWDWVAGWFSRAAADVCPANHADAFFRERILRDPARQASGRARHLRTLARRGAVLERAELDAQFTELRHRFSCHLTSFQRKRYVNVSHEPNKAMNLNTYLGLVGGSWQEVERPDGLHLIPAAAGSAHLDVPDAAYIITLDADSLLAPDYALRLTYEMERPGNDRLAVIQTPYCAIPVPEAGVERVAGATTDIQHLLHQGSTHFGATFWVGANALLRRAALEDIRTVDEERGFTVTRYIQDRTVIEDTESSIDLVHAGWKLHNYPDRLAVSATPPDFGALVIQRRRWANGGLIILPKLLRYATARPRSLRKVGEAGVRFSYLSTIASVNIALVVLLSFSFPSGEVSPWLPLVALPYFLLYARDLRHLGYRTTDLVKVYALNLLLLPVNLAGVAKSLHQAATRKKIPFSRTPKVADRTRVPSRYIAFELGLLALWTLVAAGDVAAGRIGHAVFEAVNIVLLGYAVAAFIGLRNAADDLMAFLPRRAAQPADAEAPAWDVEPEKEPSAA